MINDSFLAVADRLQSARLAPALIAPPRLAQSGAELQDAYAIQRLNAERRASAGSRLVGWKVAMTSVAVQRQFGIGFPTAGRLHEDMVHLNGEILPFGTLLQPKVEAEIAFVLLSDLDMPRPTFVEVVQAVDFALVAIEVAECRIAGWQVDVVDFVADNSAAGRVVLGEAPLDIRGVDMRVVPMTMEVDGEIRSTGNGEACLGNPLRSLAWLAQFTAVAGTPLRRGDLVMAGSLGPAVPVTADQVVRVQVSPFPDVCVQFADASS